MLEDVDDMIESYAGKRYLEEPEAELEKYLHRQSALTGKI